MSARIMIAMPTTGTVKTKCMGSVIAAMAGLARGGIESAFRSIEGSQLAHQRSALASQFLQSGFTHIMFVDSDMTFGPDLPLRMIEANKPVVGVLAAKKTFDPERFATGIRLGLSTAEAMAIAMTWVSYQNDATSPADGLYRVNMIGFGITMIERSVFTTLIERGAAKPQTEYLPGNWDNYYNFFGSIGDDHVPEDIAFCLRWARDCGGELWAIGDAEIGHIGDFVYGTVFKIAADVHTKLSARQPINSRTR